MWKVWRPVSKHQLHVDLHRWEGGSEYSSHESTRCDRSQRPLIDPPTNTVCSVCCKTVKTSGPDEWPDQEWWKEQNISVHLRLKRAQKWNRLHQHSWNGNVTKITPLLFSIEVRCSFLWQDVSHGSVRLGTAPSCCSGCQVQTNGSPSPYLQASNGPLLPPGPINRSQAILSMTAGYWSSLLIPAGYRGKEARVTWSNVQDLLPLEIFVESHAFVDLFAHTFISHFSVCSFS